MKKLIFLMVFAICVSGISCGNGPQKSQYAMVLIKTDFGDIKVRLFDDTPEHKNNFIKLINEGFYEDLLFHRVIEKFMIQGGDPSSKNAEPGKRLGGGSLDYTIPAEINSKYIHKKGALAAARKGGPSNPEKRSSSSQYYIIQGDVFTHGKLDTLEMMKNSQLKKECFNTRIKEVTPEINKFRENNDQTGFNLFVADLREKVDSIFNADLKFSFTGEQREVYTTIGGYPSLDGDYTVFGEVVEGLEILDKIAAVETDKYNRPLSDVKMKVEMLK